ncbi:protein GET4 [Rhododendron vialii]|uniref:protein GET4 n=1 Tax=Rhododendron vialii TaxID=182163 RepID=UPI00265E9241|nr:protein GET4 [Rhododendron vialii]
MSTRERPRRGVLPPAQENIEKIAKVVKDGNCYGAQQMYKSISARYISAERYSEALDILHSGSCIQLEHGQLTCGAELALLFVETLVKGKYPYDEDTLDRVRKIYKKFPRIPVPQHLDLGDDDDMQKLSEALGAAKVRVECCSSFLKAAIKWSAEVGAHRNGSPELHDMLAEYIYSESPEADMARVSYHFVRGKHPRKFASTLVNFMGKCYPGEDDVAIARAILMYLSHGNLRDANCLMDELKKQLKGKDLDFPKSDLIQLINFLLQTLQRDALPLFNMLRQTYKSSIDREPVFNELLDVIAEIFYEVPRRNPLMQGMFGDIFKMMGGDGM